MSVSALSTRQKSLDGHFPIFSTFCTRVPFANAINQQRTTPKKSLNNFKKKIMFKVTMTDNIRMASKSKIKSRTLEFYAKLSLNSVFKFLPLRN